MDARVRLVLTAAVGVEAFHHRQCNRARQSDFQFDDCYIPDLDTDVSIRNVPFVYAHNAATGYIDPHAISKTGLSWWYSKNQIGTIANQLDAGARALDVRPHLLDNGTMVASHGSIRIDVGLAEMVRGAQNWASDNLSELVLIVHSHFSYESYNPDVMVEALTAVYQQLNVPYVACDDIVDLTVGEVMELAALDQGGYLLAVDGQDGYRSCVNENYDTSNLVTCYNGTVSCRSSPEPLYRLQNYLYRSAGVESDAVWNELQAIWQVDARAAVEGARRVSSILDDNRQSHLNAAMVDFFYHNLSGIGGLIAVDNVVEHGNALLSVVRTACGVSTLEEACGSAVPPPKLYHWHWTWHATVYAFLTAYAVVSLVVAVRQRHQSRVWQTARARCEALLVESDRCGAPLE